MAEGHVHFPYHLTPETLSEFSWEVHNLPATDKLFFWAGPSRFMSPTALILLPKICASRWRKHKSEGMAFYNLEGLTYADNLGFSDALRLRGQPYPQGAFGGRNYIPISSMRKKTLDTWAAEQWVELGDAIQAQCDEIAPVVFQGMSGKFRLS